MMKIIQTGTKHSRFVHLDLLKGIAILEFICWHVFQNFYEYTPNTAELHRVVFSVTGFFVLASGYILGSHYYPKLRDKKITSAYLLKRIFTRSLKLIFIVFAANICINFISMGFSLEAIVDTKKILTLFYLDRWDISLQVLLAIALTLVLGAVLLIFIYYYQHTLLIVSLVIFMIIAIDLVRIDPLPYLWRYLLHGITGIVLGIIFNNKYQNNILTNTFVKFHLYTFGSIFILITILVSSDSSVHKFFLFKLGPDILAATSYLIGLGSIFFLLYDLRQLPLGIFSKILECLGRHSLFVYLLQIIIIDLTVIVFDNFRLGSQWECLVLTVLITSFCYIFTCVILKIRKCSRSVNILYRIVFE